MSDGPQRVDSVTAVDISSAHLALAQQHAIENAVHGIQWRHLESISALEDLPQVDVVYSIIVLQHNPPPVIDRSTCHCDAPSATRTPISRVRRVTMNDNNA